MWVCSADSHFLEPVGYWNDILPERLARRMPRSERVGDNEEIIYVDGQTLRRPLPRYETRRDDDGLTIMERNHRPPGVRDARSRLADLDQEGVWGEVIYASLGLWSSLIKDPTLIRAAARAHNEWVRREIQEVAPERLVPAAMMPTHSVGDAVAEVEHIAAIGLHCANLPTRPAETIDDYTSEVWEPLWAAAEECNLVLSFHIGDVGDPTGYRGAGGAVLNYLETTYGGQRAAAKLVACGALDRHPGLRVLVSEGGATWVPFVGDRMNEAYRQHGMYVRPKLSRLPKDILYEQVYSSFQHDESAPAAAWAMGYPNVCWGSDYPHTEGTFGHTQETLHQLFDAVDDQTRERITWGAFLELLPHVTRPPHLASAGQASGPPP
jgi:predicted TIM-barrel fold metal-dependent hydrolase